MLKGLSETFDERCESEYGLLHVKCISQQFVNSIQFSFHFSAFFHQKENKLISEHLFQCVKAFTFFIFSRYCFWQTTRPHTEINNMQCYALVFKKYKCLSSDGEIDKKLYWTNMLMSKKTCIEIFRLNRTTQFGKKIEFITQWEIFYYKLLWNLWSFFDT